MGTGTGVRGRWPRGGPGDNETRDSRGGGGGKGRARRKAEMRRAGSTELMELLSGSYFPANEAPLRGEGPDSKAR